MDSSHGYRIVSYNRAVIRVSVIINYSSLSTSDAASRNNNSLLKPHSNPASLPLIDVPATQFFCTRTSKSDDHLLSVLGSSLRLACGNAGKLTQWCCLSSSLVNTRALGHFGMPKRAGAQTRKSDVQITRPRNALQLKRQRFLDNTNQIGASPGLQIIRSR